MRSFDKISRIVGRDDTALEYLGSMAIGLVLLLILLVAGIKPFAGAVAEHHRSAVRSHLHLETATIISRGPYQGDVADASHREVTVQYKDWSGEPAKADYLVPWGVTVGQKLPIVVGQNVVVLLAALNHQPGNPWDQGPGAKAIWTGIMVALAALILAICGGVFAYWLLLNVKANREVARQRANINARSA